MLFFQYGIGSPWPSSVINYHIRNDVQECSNLNFLVVINIATMYNNNYYHYWACYVLETGTSDLHVFNFSYYPLNPSVSDDIWLDQDHTIKTIKSLNLSSGISFKQHAKPGFAAVSSVYNLCQPYCHDAHGCLLPNTHHTCSWKQSYWCRKESQ